MEPKWQYLIIGECHDVHGTNDVEIAKLYATVDTNIVIAVVSGQQLGRSPHLASIDKVEYDPDEWTF